MKIKELLEKLKNALDSSDEFHRPMVSLKIKEPNATWFGNFVPIDVVVNKNRHDITIVCEGQTTNFLEVMRDREQQKT